MPDLLSLFSSAFAALGLTVTNHSFAAEEAEFDSEFCIWIKG